MENNYLIKTAFLDGQKIAQRKGNLGETGYINKLLRFAKLKEYKKWSDIVIKLYNDCELIFSEQLIECIAGKLNETDTTDYVYAFMLGANNKRSKKEVDEIINNLNESR